MLNVFCQSNITPLTQMENFMAKAKDAGKLKTVERKLWKPFGEAVYAEVMHGLVHFSAKTVNSNTPACGIRLGAEALAELPYVAVASTYSVPLDYTSSGTNGGNATVLAQISAALADNIDELFEGAIPGEIETIKILSQEILSTSFETGTAGVGMRLRQIIVQDAEGNDVALTPLQSAGFSATLAERIELLIEKQEGEHKYYWPRGFLGIGGSNPQNVGRHVRAMNRPLFFTAPTDKYSMRTAYALHHRGISLAPPKALLKDYIRWRKRLLSVGGGGLPSDAATRKKEVDFIRAVVAAIDERAATARRLLEDAMDDLPGQKLLADDVDDADGLMHGLIFPAARTTAWKHDFAQKLHRRILDTAVKINGDEQTIGVGEFETARWVAIIEEAL